MRLPIVIQLLRILLLGMLLAGLIALQGVPRAGGQALNQMTLSGSGLGAGNAAADSGRRR